MPLDRERSTTSVIDVLDHALDKGIVIDAWVRVSVTGIDLLTVAARVVVASVATYVNERDPMPELATSSTPAHTLEEQLHRMRAQFDRRLESLPPDHPRRKTAKRTIPHS
jgi:gas vesicle structural protein